MFVFIHIPKTAGTSLGNLFDLSTDRRILWDYDPEYRYATTIQPELRDHMDFIKSYFRVLFGHFYNKKYATVLPDADYLTCVRHPVKRIVSQYYHVALEGRNWQSQYIRDGKMDVVSFAQTGNIANAQQQHLEGRELRNYGHIFITEHLSSSLTLFQKKYDFKFQVGLSKLNTNAARQAGMKDNMSQFAIKTVTKEEEAKVFGLCRDDVEIYRESVDILTQESRTLG